MEDKRIGDIKAIALPVLESLGLEVVEFDCRPQGRRLLIRFLVDTIGGVRLNQCARANQLIGQALEEADFIEEGYMIEVSSPGLDRPLVSNRDFERAVGEQLQLVVTEDAVHFKEVRGMLLAVQEAAIILRTASGTSTIPMEQIKKAQKAIDW